MSPALFLGLPVLTTLLGGVVAALRPPKARTRAALQHFAAGVVFAAAASELLPEILKRRRPGEVVLGFVVGTGLMLAVKAATQRVSSSGERSQVGLLLALGIDVLVDGILVGMGFSAGEHTGILLSIALSLELAFLGVSAVTAVCSSGWSRGAAILLTAGLGAVFLVGALPAAVLFRHLSAGALDVFMSFGLVALLYLVTEELLVEAHAVEETPVATATFFAGFLALILLAMQVEL